MCILLLINQHSGFGTPAVQQLLQDGEKTVGVVLLRLGRSRRRVLEKWCKEGSSAVIRGLDLVAKKRLGCLCGDYGTGIFVAMAIFLGGNTRNRGIAVWLPRSGREWQHSQQDQES